MVVGLDEAGRGPLAGPVYAAAVILKRHPEDLPLSWHSRLRDSKKLAPAARTELARRVQSEGVAWAIAWCDAGEIDQLNIHHASLLAMTRAYHSIATQLATGISTDTGITLVQVDGKFTPPIPVSHGRPRVEAVIGGDHLVPEIMAASILAKTARDAFMVRCDHDYPGYDFARHKGYPTLLHRQRIAERGPSPIHRRSFRLPASDS